MQTYCTCSIPLKFLLIGSLTGHCIFSQLNLSKMTPHSPRRKQIRMRIHKEPRRILFNLFQRERSPRIPPIRPIQTSGKRTRHATNTNPLAVTT